MQQLKLIKTTNPVEIKNELDFLLKNQKSSSLIKINFFLLLFVWILYFIAFNFFPPEFPLFYSKPWGQEQLTNTKVLLILPIILTFVTVINTRLASIFFKKENLLSLIFLANQLIFTLLTLIYFIQMILLLL
ncbi:hypothetical protein GYA19_06130 [Candidatus Beckwithbacteria bacterium]|nr:hypothetical protein [Candidatus Beckwithbacteria bacterium]